MPRLVNFYERIIPTCVLRQEIWAQFAEFASAFELKRMIAMHTGSRDAVLLEESL